MIATSCICDPVTETDCAAHNRRKSRCRSAANDGGRAVSGVGTKKICRY
ncbi:MAG: hypothetical protein LC800_06250 [Acidobacteria bacterium]|nr:hypothetical protein [Acidobacteriota bacterium]